MTNISELFFVGKPERIQINFRSTPVLVKKGGKEFIEKIEPDDPRWKKTKVNGKPYLHDIIDDAYIPFDVIARSMKKKLPITLAEEPSLQCGTSTFKGVNKMMKNDPLDAFLSAHAIFLRKLRILVCINKYGVKESPKKLKIIERKYMASKAIKYLSEKNLIKEDELVILIQYNKDRNKLHNFDSGTSTGNIRKNINLGRQADEILNNLFQNIKEE